MIRRRGRHDVGLVRGLLLLAALVLVVGVLDVAEHLGLIILAVALGAGGFAAGRRYERGRPASPEPQRSPRNAPEAATAPFSAIPAGPDPADQIAMLEKLAARPLASIIESYKLRQQKYGAGRD